MRVTFLPQAALRSKELFKSIQRYYSNAITDAEKQDALNLFLGHFRPQDNRPALWELDSDYHLHVGGANSPTDSPTGSQCGSRSSLAQSEWGTGMGLAGGGGAGGVGGGRGLFEGGDEIPFVHFGHGDGMGDECAQGFTFGPLPLSEIDGSGTTKMVSFDKLIPRMSLTKLKPVRLYPDSPSNSLDMTSGGSAGTLAKSALQATILRQTTSNDRLTVESATPGVSRRFESSSGGVEQEPLEPTEEGKLKEKYSTWMGPFLGPESSLDAAYLDSAGALGGGAGGEGMQEDAGFYVAYLESPLQVLESPRNETLYPFLTQTQSHGHSHSHSHSYGEKHTQSPGYGYSDADVGYGDRGMGGEEEWYRTQQTVVSMAAYLASSDQMSLRLDSDAPHVTPSELCLKEVDRWCLVR